MASSQGETIVVIDDDYTIRLSCQAILTRSGYGVEGCEDGAQGLAAVARLKPMLAIVDLKMPGIPGLEVIRRIREVEPETEVVVITGYATVDTAVEALKAGAYDFLPKPFSPDELRVIVSRALERRHLLQDSRRLEMERELLKRRFVTFVSHQLQSPLVAIHQYLDVLRILGDAPEVAAKREEWIDRCLRRTEEMQALIRDWLTLSKVEGNVLGGEPRPVDLRSTIREVIEGCRTTAEAAGVSLEADLPTGPLLVLGDASCVEVLVENLVDNAIKYNRPAGSVRVAVATHAGELELTVEDTGVGIPEESRAFVFDEFYRVRREAVAAVSGTGLGLPICRRIVREMGGTISLESEVDAGTTFRVRLPEHHPVSVGAEPPVAVGILAAESEPDRTESVEP